MAELRARAGADPFDSDALGRVFRLDPAHQDRLLSRESTSLEFKQAFNWSNNAEYAKAIASFANNKGGYIVFGVANRPHTLLGLSSERFANIDHAEVAEFLNTVMSPEIEWDRYVYEFGGKSYGLIYVWESRDKPVMSIRNAGSCVREAEVYYRYRGRSERIKYPELRRLLDEKRGREEALWLKHLSEMARVGVEDVAVLDLQSGRASAVGGTVLIDESLVPQLRRIAAGQQGVTSQPELRIEGKIIPSGFIQPVREVAMPVVLSSADIIRAFLRQARVPAPEQYVRQICLEPSGYLPVYYFARLAQLTLPRLVELVENTRSRSPAKKTLVQRLRSTDDLSCQRPKGKNAHSEFKREWLRRIASRTVKLDVSSIEVSRFLRAVCALGLAEVDVAYLFPVLLKVFDEHYERREAYVVQNLRRALCHLDRVLNRPAVETTCR